MTWKFAAILCLTACGGGAPHRDPATVGTRAPGSLIGDFHRTDERGTAMRFSSDGTCLVAASAPELAQASTRCTWRLDGNRLTFTNSEGTCAESDATRVGVYDVVVREQGVSFKLVSDTCERRMSIDGETWARMTK